MRRRGPLARPFYVDPRGEIRRRLARWCASQTGYQGNDGGWIYHTVSRLVICQGWDAFYLRKRRAIWDAIFGTGAYDEAEDERIQRDAARFVQAYQATRASLWDVFTRGLR